MGLFTKIKSLFLNLLHPKKTIQGVLIRRPLYHHRVIKRLTHLNNENILPFSLSVCSNTHDTTINQRSWINKKLQHYVSPLQILKSPLQRYVFTLWFHQPLVTDKHIKKK